MRMPYLLCGALMLGVTSGGLAQADPPAERSGDPRIRTLLYDPEQVFEVQVASGFALTLALAPDERVENVIVGNSAAWQVTPSRRGDHLSVKPVQDGVETNMTVITDARRYSFLLRPASDPAAAAFDIRFRYAGVPRDVETIVAATPPAFYKVSGDRLLRPGAMGDDGERTTIRWPDGVALPAIYTVDERGRESIVNGRMVDGDYVVPGVAARFRFRRDGRQATATRQLPKARP